MQSRGALLTGVLMILIGGWLLAQNFGAALPGLEQLWPAFPLLGGLAFLVQYFANGRRDDGLVFVGVAAALVGGFFFAFTLGPLRFDEGDMRRWWPVFVLIGAAASLAQWLAQPREWGRLAFASLAALVGTVALAATLGYLDRGQLAQLARWWPVLLIVAGLMALASALAGRGRGRS